MKGLKELFERRLDDEYNKRLCAQFVEWGACCRVIGHSVQGREISVLTLGQGRRQLFYLCSTHATESIAGNVMLAFAKELLTQDAVGALRRNTLHILPLLNPDGVEIAQGRISDADRARLIFFNDGNEDFTHWQANARGVDLNHNFDADFARGKAFEREHGICGPSPTRYGGKAPFSEPETQAVRDFIIKENIDVLFALHTQGEEIYYGGRGSLSMARIFAKASGYAVSEPEGITSCRGAKDWFCKTFDRPGFTVELGKGENPLPMSDAKGIWRKCREMLSLTTIIS